MYYTVDHSSGSTVQYSMTVRRTSSKYHIINQSKSYVTSVFCDIFHYTVHQMLNAHGFIHAVRVQNHTAFSGVAPCCSRMQMYYVRYINYITYYIYNIMYQSEEIKAHSLYFYLSTEVIVVKSY